MTEKARKVTCFSPFFSFKASATSEKHAQRRCGAKKSKKVSKNCAFSPLTWSDAPSSGTASRSTKPSVRSATKPSAALSNADSLVGLTAPVEASKTMSRSRVPTDAVEFRSTLRTTKG